MALSGVAALSFIVLLATFKIGTSLKCYVCHSGFEPNCQDPFLKDSLESMDCSSRWWEDKYYNLKKYFAGDTNYCGKIVTRNGPVTRLCYKSSVTNPMKTCENIYKDPRNKVTHCSVCDKDGCNGVNKVTASFSLIAFIIILSYLVYK